MAKLREFRRGAKIRVRAAALQRKHDYALILGPHIELRGRGQQGGAENSRSENAREASADETRDSGGRAGVGGVAGNGERQHLGIGQSLSLGKAIGLSRVKVQHSAI